MKRWVAIGILGVVAAVLAGLLAYSQVELGAVRAELQTAQAEALACQSSYEAAVSPRNFSSETELANWLAADDTDSLTLYSSLEYATTLREHAAADGYAIFVHFVDADGDILWLDWACNTTVIGNKIYMIFAPTDDFIFFQYTYDLLY